MESPGPRLVEILARCLESDKQADWEQFVLHAQPVVGAGAARALRRWNAVSAQLLQDIVQDAFVRLCDRNFQVLRGFRADHPDALLAYLRAVGSSAACDHKRTRSAQKRGSGNAETSLEGMQIENGENTLDLTRRTLLGHDIEKCLQGQKDRDRKIYWLYYRQGFSVREISTIFPFGLTSSGIESKLLRLNQIVRKCLGIHGPSDDSTGGEGNRR
jgi:RNA polymerase sigma-70 factor (ECF subfamily)